LSQPLITAIVSTYNAEKFIKGCIEDLITQTIFDELEILIIDSGSTQNESAICENYAKKHKQITLIRTEREPLYTAWNRAIHIANGKYLTNANTDDRHSSSFMEIMVNALEKQSEIGLVYSEQYISNIENETFEQCQKRAAKIRRLPNYAPEELMLRCMTGSQPMWRKSIHDRLGFFDTNYIIAADYDMWLRIAAQFDFFHVPGPLGSLYESPDTISGSNNIRELNTETLSIQKHHLNKEKWRNLPGIKQKIASELFGRGYQRITHDNDNRAAEPFIREAFKLDPTNLRYLKTYLIRCIFNINNSKINF
jgi:glycosyltransferase involved in cell wall biosynthesis